MTDVYLIFAKALATALVVILIATGIVMLFWGLGGSFNQHSLDSGMKEKII